MHTARLALLAGLALLGGSCVYPAGDNRVFVTSDPPGAEVLLNGAPTGQTTPAMLDLGGIFGQSHKIQVRKQGFEPEERVVTHHTRWDTAKLNDGAADYGVWPLPLFWTVGDLVFPIEVRWSYVPHDLYVKLFPEGTFLPKPGETLEKAPATRK